MRVRSLMMVDLPLPFAPTTTTRLPAGMRKETSRSAASFDFSPGYAKETLLNGKSQSGLLMGEW
jgi:hypothetical protein